MILEKLPDPIGPNRPIDSAFGIPTINVTKKT